MQKTVDGVVTAFVYDMSGNVMLETDGSTDLKAGYIYLNGQMLVEYKDGITYFAHKDHLGSTRLLTKLDKSPQECDGYLPFGELDTSVCTPPVGTTTTTHKFTGKERDAESGLDFFGARYARIVSLS